MFLLLDEIRALQYYVSNGCEFELNELIKKYKEILKQKIDEYKLTLEWAESKNMSDVDIEVLTTIITTYQDCLIELQTLELEEIESKKG